MKTHKDSAKKAIRHAWKEALRRLVIQRPVPKAPVHTKGLDRG